jgi:NADPH2:quinone reductase
MGDAVNLSAELLQDFIDAVTAGQIHLNIDKTFTLNQVANAHRYMESNQSKGKLVVVV